MSGTLSLDRSLRTEWSLGFVRFSNIVKAVLHNYMASVVDVTVSKKKKWFVLVRKMRGNIGDRGTSDKFSDPKSSIFP